MDIENAIEIEVDTSSESSIPTEIEKAGPAGLSAYQIAVKDGFVGTEEEWLSSLKGDPGETGATGQPGPQGLPGRDGAIQYTAGDNITIENNVISATGGDLSNYYTKAETNTLINNKIPTYEIKLTTPITFPQSVYPSNDFALFSDVFTDAYSKGYEVINILITANSGNGGAYRSQIMLMPNIKYGYLNNGSDNIQNKPTRYHFTCWQNMQYATSPASSTDWPILAGGARVDITWSAENVASVSYVELAFVPTQIVTTKGVLTRTNNEVYTPTSNYHPATKKYVDDSIASAITTTLGGSY